MANLPEEDLSEYLTNDLFQECFSDIYAHFNIEKMGPRMVDVRLCDQHDFAEMLRASTRSSSEAKLELAQLIATLPLRGKDAMKTFYREVLLVYDEEKPGDRDMEIIINSIKRKAHQRRTEFFLRRSFEATSPDREVSRMVSSPPAVPTSFGMRPKQRISEISVDSDYGSPLSSTSSLRPHEKNPRLEEMTLLRSMEEKINMLTEEMEQLRGALKETKEDLKMSIKVAISATVHSVCKHPSRSLSDSNVISVPGSSKPYTGDPLAEDTQRSNKEGDMTSNSLSDSPRLHQSQTTKPKNMFLNRQAKK